MSHKNKTHGIAMETRYSVLSSFKCMCSAFKRSYKRYVVLVGLLATVAIVVTLQFINNNQLRHLLVYNTSRRIGSVTTARRLDILSRITPKIQVTEKLASLTPYVDLSLSKITPKPNLHRLINASKTLYPITVNAPYLIENPRMCSSVRNLSVLVIVHTAPNHFERRQAIRETWTNDTYYSKLGSVKVLFLLGRVKNTELQIKIENEYKEHGDLLQGDFLDAYRNLTHKGVMGYKWIAERCRNAKFILKVDDDVIVNMFKFFVEYVPKFGTKSKQIFCNHIHPGTMLIIRNKKSKWYVDGNHFKGHKFYPRYCSGFMVMITNDAIPAIFRSATLTPFFWVDDVYLYGLVPGNVPGIHYNDLKKGSHQLNGQLALKCYRNASRTCNYLVTGAGSREVMVEVWSNMVNIYSTLLKVKKHITEGTTLPTEVSTGFSSVDETKSSNQRAEENIGVIMNGKILQVEKVAKRLDTGTKFV